jgi:hypothetical protein
LDVSKINGLTAEQEKISEGRTSQETPHIAHIIIIYVLHAAGGKTPYFAAASAIHD